jgi:hypothetical protein
MRPSSQGRLRPEAVLREDDYFHNRQIAELDSVDHLGNVS